MSRQETPGALRNTSGKCELKGKIPRKPASISSAISRIRARLGFYVRTALLPLHRMTPRASLLGVLRQAYDLALRPSTVLDVGAAYGSFTQDCYSVFPESRYILVEPLEEYGTHLDEVVRTIPRADYTLAAAASKPGETTINVHPDLVGSSLYLESEDSNVNGVPRTVPAVTLDSLCQDKKTLGPYLIKIDAQGAELDVLEGAARVLREAEFVLLEVSFFQFFEGGPQFHDVVQYMKSKGFVVYDVFGLQYRLLDNALSQADVVFVLETGRFRAHHYYATRDQRERQTRLLQSAMKRSR